MQKGRIIIFVFLLCLIQILAFGQGADETFGKNRVQFGEFRWENYSTTNFDVYFYQGGNRAAKFASYFLETEFDDMADLLGYTPSKKAKVFIYNSTRDLQQSNIGLGKEGANNGGQANFLNSQAEIAYKGSEVQFKKDLRVMMGQIYVHEMLYGGSLKDVIQSTYLSDFTEWFQLGAAAYVAEGWSQEMDDFVMELFISKKIKKPNLLEGKDAILVGQSIWNFIAEKYGKYNISNILNLARIIRNEKKSITNTLGISYRKIFKEWENYYEEQIPIYEQGTEPIQEDFKLRKNNRKRFGYNSISISPDGERALYSENKRGRFRVIVQELYGKKKKRVIFRGGYNAIYQIYDPAVPLLRWQDNSNVALVHYEDDYPTLSIYGLNKKLTFEKSWFTLGQIHSFDFSDDGNLVIMSTIRQGQSSTKSAQNDLMVYNIELDFLKQISSDWADDLYPTFLQGSNEQVIFSSNRTDDSLKTNLVTELGPYNENTDNFNLFQVNISDLSQPLKRILDISGNTLRPTSFDDNTIIYSNNINGLNQLYRLNLTTLASVPITNHPQSIQNFDVNPSTYGLLFIAQEKGKQHVFYRNNYPIDDQALTFTTARALKVRENNFDVPNLEGANTIETNPETNSNLAPDEVDTDNYEFSPEALQEFENVSQNDNNNNNSPPNLLDILPQLHKKEVKLLGPYIYEPLARAEGITTTFQVDPILGFGPVLGVDISDLREDHRLRGGIFLNGNLQLRNSSLYGEYSYLAKRLDYTFSYKRYVINSQNENSSNRATYNEFGLMISYPFTNLHRVSVFPFYANRTFTSDNLAEPDLRIEYGGFQLEYVFDNTIINGMNMMEGTRVKATFRQFFGGPGQSNENLNKLTIDARNYFKVHRDLIWANRVAYGRFGGPGASLFRLGGMDNWIGNSTDPGSNDAANNQNSNDLLFVDHVTNLRGFNLNKQSGTNYLVFNSELRFPIIKYIFGKRINSNFLKNLQFAGFFDIGTAWSSGNPFSRVNSVTTTPIEDPNLGDDQTTAFTGTVNDFTNPFLSGYGFGARTFLFGYYLKVDVAWAIEDFVVSNEPRYYITFGYDF